MRAAGCSNLALGTVQLGIPYGFANTTGQPDQNTATAIVATAWASGVRYFDTAQAYGAGESVLGSAIQALGCDGIDIVQVPANIFDRRMARAGVFKLAEEMGKQIFIRSIYLQGLALMTPEQVKIKMPFAFGACERFQGFCQQHGLSPLRFAIDHIRSQAPTAKIIIGAETMAQVRENCIQFNAPSLPVALHRLWTDEWPEDCIELIDPRMWPATKKIQP